MSLQTQRMTVCPLPLLLMVIALSFAGWSACGTGYAANQPSEIRVGSELEFPPYALLDEKGEPAGFSIDLIKAVAQAMGLSIKTSTGPWDTVWNDLVAGRLDVLPIVAKLPERRPLVDFSLPHTETYDAFFVRKGTYPIKNIQEAQGKEIVVMRSDAAHHELLKRNFPGRLILVDTIPEGLSLISSGRHDALLCSKLIGTLSIKKHGLKGLTAGPPIPDYKRVFSFAVKKGDAELLEKLNQGLLIIKTNGEYNKIYDQWLTADDPWRMVEKYLFPALAGLIALALIVGFWLVMLQLLVNKRTRQLAEKNEMLRSAQEGLEKRVTERTAELSQSNAQLRMEVENRRKTEEALRQAHERALWLARFPEENPNPVVQAAADGTVLYCNPSTRDPHDWPCLVGQPLDSRLGPLVSQALETGEEGQQDVEIGSRLFSVWVVPFPAEDYANVYGRDITKGRKAEEALRESEERFATAFRVNPNGLVLSRISDRMILDVNQAFLSLIGYTREEVIGRTSHSLGLFVDPEKRDQAVGLLLRQESVRDYEVQIRCRSGEERTVLLSAEILHIGKENSFLTIIQDITERKKSEEELKKAHEELEKRVQERTVELSEAVQRLRAENIQRRQLEEILRESESQVRFFASQCLTAQEDERKRIANELHDSIASSLSGLKFRIEKIGEEMKQGIGNLDSMMELPSKVAEINSEVRRIMADLRPAVLDDLGIVAAVNWFCREYEKTYSPIQVNNRISLSEQDVPDSLRTPIFRISQEAMNNIAKYSGASLVNLSLKREDTKIFLVIEDNGQGFDREKIRRGLGLSTMLERAQFSGGSFDLESAPGRGTIIRLSWPIK